MRDMRSSQHPQKPMPSPLEQPFSMTARELWMALSDQQYFVNERTCRQIVSYLRLNKPIGLRGEPGVGKSELPERFASLIGAKMVDIECHSQLEAMDIGVSWNGLRQLVDAQSGRLRGEPFSMNYLNHTPLVTSLLSDEPVVVRVDEVDKLNEHTSNFFLRYLDKRQLVVHDLTADNPDDKVLCARAPIYVFLTSNDYRELDPAMMRRVAWVDLAFPEERDLANILSVKGGAPETVAHRIAHLVIRLRGLPLKKQPSIGEALEWTHALLLETGGKLTLDAIDVTIGILLKYRDDLTVGWEALRSWFDRF